MKQLVKLNKWPRCGGRKFIYALRCNGKDGKRKGETLGHANQLKTERQCDQIRQSSRRIAKTAMNDFIGTIGNIDFRSVTIAHSELYRQASLDRGKSNATVKKGLAAIKRLFTLAINCKQLDENPFQHIAMPKLPKKKINIYADAQCKGC